jgi:hypothetical protein
VARGVVGRYALLFLMDCDFVMNYNFVASC